MCSETSQYRPNSAVMSDPMASPLGIEAQPGWPEMRSAKRSNQPMTGTRSARWPKPPMIRTIVANPKIAPATPRSSSENPPAGGDFGGSAAARRDRPAYRELMRGTLARCHQLVSHSLMFTFWPDLKPDPARFGRRESDDLRAEKRG